MNQNDEQEVAKPDLTDPTDPTAGEIQARLLDPEYREGYKAGYERGVGELLEKVNQLLQTSPGLYLVNVAGMRIVREMREALAEQHDLEL